MTFGPVLAGFVDFELDEPECLVMVGLLEAPSQPSLRKIMELTRDAGQFTLETAADVLGASASTDLDKAPQAAVRSREMAVVMAEDLATCALRRFSGRKHIAVSRESLQRITSPQDPQRADTSRLDLPTAISKTYFAGPGVLNRDSLSSRIPHLPGGPCFVAGTAGYALALAAVDDGLWCAEIRAHGVERSLAHQFSPS